MKLVPLLLAGSLVANLALGVALALRSSGAIETISVTATLPAASAKSGAATIIDADHPDPETWSNLATTDQAAMAARLREQGFPASVQRAILAALITERFADRHKALADLIASQPWWRGNLFGGAEGAKILAERQKLQRDEKEALEQLLGPDTGLTDYARARQNRAYGADLAPAKMSELDRIAADYDQLMGEVRNGSQGILLPEDRAKLAYLDQEKRADIAKLLSPDELLELDLRSSPSAGQLRNQLAAFGPSEDEYRALFKLQQAFDAKYGNPEYLTNDQRRDRSAAQADLLKQAESVLPPERYAELKTKTDGNYLAAYAVVTRLQLPATATDEVVAVQKDINQRAQTVMADRSLSGEQRNGQLMALGSEAVMRLTPTLGDAGVAAYKQSGGNWINNLQRPPPPPKK